MEKEDIKEIIHFFLFACIYDLTNLTPEELVSFYKECLVFGRFVDNTRTVLNCYIQLGILYRDKLFLYEEAKDSFKRGVSLSLTLLNGKSLDETCARKYGEALGVQYGELGHAYHLLERYEDEIKCNQAALQWSIKFGVKENEGYAYDALGTTYGSIGKFGKAMEFYKKALDIAIEMDNKPGVRCVFANIGNLHQNLGKPKEAITFFIESLNIAIATGDKVSEGMTYGCLADCFRSLGYVKSAEKNYIKKLDIATKIGNKKLEESAYSALAILYIDAKKYEKALELYHKGIAIAEILGLKSSVAIWYSTISNMFVNAKDFDTAISYCKKALELYQDIENVQGKANSHRNLGMCYREKYRFISRIIDALPPNMVKEHEEISQEIIDKALDHSRESVKLFHWLYEQLQQEHHFKISYMDEIIEAYKDLSYMLMITGETQEAMLVAERSRARVLVDLLTNKYGMAMGKVNSLSFNELETAWKKGNFSVLFLNLLGDNVFYWHLENEEIHSATKREEDPLEKLREQGAEFGTGVFISEVLDEVHQFLKVVAGVRCENRSLEISDTSSANEPLPRGNSDNMKTPENTKEEGTLNPLMKLYKALVPYVKYYKQDEVVIIPEGLVYLVPFAALQDPETGQYLSEIKRIRLAPSLTMLKQLQECPADYHSKTGALVIGNPDVGEVMLRGNRVTLPSLPAASMEAICVANQLGVKPLVGANATKDVVLEKLEEGVAVIHIAAHGCPDNGEIALSPSTPTASQPPEEKDYLLTMREVQDVGVRSQLVVLSCCQSGNGEIKTEGVVGLARAFLAAGARAVIASLWAIDDDATLSYMLSLYEYLRKGKSASESMQYAASELRREWQFREPRYWASFFLIGDDVTIR